MKSTNKVVANAMASNFHSPLRDDYEKYKKSVKQEISALYTASAHILSILAKEGVRLRVNAQTKDDMESVKAIEIIGNTIVRQLRPIVDDLRQLSGEANAL